MLPLLGAAIVLVAGAASSALGTQAHQHSSPAALALAAAVGAFFGVVVITGLPNARLNSPREWLPEVLAGAGGFALAPYIIMANRFTDAPPGSEVLFFTTASWGAMLSGALAIAAKDRISRLGGTLLALAGAAAVVANWERPSSFSPFVRYAREEVLMLLAGVLWVGLVLVLLSAAKRRSLPPAALRSGLGGIAGALVMVAVCLFGGTLEIADFSWAGVWAFSIAVGFATAGMLVVLRSRSAFGIAAAYLLTPASLTLLLLLEQVVGVRGPNPLLVGPILAATVSAVAGLWISRGAASGSATQTSIGPRPRIAQVVAALSLAASMAALALPGMTAAVSATRADGSAFEATFGLYGLEVAGTWLAVGVTLAALGVTLERPVWREGLQRAAALVVAVVAWPFVAATPLRTLTSFIPSDVQVDYGSEFARIDFTGGPPLIAIVAMGGALLAVAVTLSLRMPMVDHDASELDRKAVSQ